MARIIGYNINTSQMFYKAVCPHCGAIVLFEERDLIDDVWMNEYNGTFGHCPGCGKKITVKKS